MSETKIKRREICDWVEQDNGPILTSCKKDFHFDDENLEDSCSWAKFCIFCGGKIIPHFYEEEDDGE